MLLGNGCQANRGRPANRGRLEVGEWQDLVLEPEWLASSVQHRHIGGGALLQLVGTLTRVVTADTSLLVSALAEGFRPRTSQGVAVLRTGRSGLVPAWMIALESGVVALQVGAEELGSANPSLIIPLD
jgi:hypothetical protein